jgi:hypothetical protein
MTEFSTGKVIGINRIYSRSGIFREFMPRINDLLTMDEISEVKLLVYKSSGEQKFLLHKPNYKFPLLRGAKVISLERELKHL